MKRPSVKLAPVKATPLRLPTEATLEQGIARILRNCLRQIEGNAPGLRQNDDPEHVHQMRVGLRRLRCALGLFKRWLKPPPTLLEELAWLGGPLGAARDADVLAGSTLPRLLRDCPAAERAALESLLAAARLQAAQRQQQAWEAVYSDRYASLLQELHRLCEKTSSAWSADRQALDSPLTQVAPGLLRRRRRKVKACSEVLAAQGSQADLALHHSLRIAVKKARYAGEFFQSLKPAKAKSSPALRAWQEDLGRLNDDHIACLLLAEMASSDATLAPAACFARGFLQAQMQARMQRLAHYSI